MNKNLYVGNLTANVTEDVIRDNFGAAGAVQSVNIIKDNYTRESRGFGFVEMETEEGAKKAIEMFHDGKLDGNTIVVNEARPRKEQGRGGGGGGRQGQRRNDNRSGGFGGGRRY
ncbi:MAG: RNA-binding protein [Deltaproteobacteria bacterium]|nr:RNA-binding protein [Deltaproteobacteria bacterium]